MAGTLQNLSSRSAAIGFLGISHRALPKECIEQHEYDVLNQRIATTRPDGHAVSWLSYGSGHLHGPDRSAAPLIDHAFQQTGG